MITCFPGTLTKFQEISSISGAILNSRGFPGIPDTLVVGLTSVLD